jgi:Icc-related predicted phosphoesterase
MTRDDLIQQYGSIRAAARAMGMAETTLRERLGRGQSVQVTLSEKKSVNTLKIRSGSIVIGSDAHYSPGLVTTAHKAFCNVIAEYASDIDAVILNGDLLDGARISKHARIGWQKTYSVKEELHAVQERLAEIEKVARGMKLLRTTGNHDIRFDSKLAAMAPEYEGIQGFALADHLPRWHDSYRIDVNDDTKVIHAVANGMHAAYNNVVKGSGFHVVTGHTHRLQAVQFRGFGQLRYGIETGMLADPEQDEFAYLTGRNANWQSGFAVLTWRDGELLYPEFCAVRDDGKAYFRGQRVG